MAFGTSKRAAQIPNATASTFSLARILGHETYDTDPLSKTADTLKAYQGWIYSCVSTISGDVRRSSWNIWQKAGASREEWKPLDNAQLPAVLLRPNASQTWGDLIELTQVHLDLAGKAFWHIITRPGSNKAIGLQALNPDWIDEPIFDSTKTRHIGWRVNIPGAQRREIAAEDVLFFRYPDPVDPFGGMSPLRAVAMAHDMDTYARAYGASHLRNHAQPTGILTTEAELTRDQAGAIAENWKDTHLGTESIQVLGKGAQYQPLSASIRDLEFLTLARVSRDQILAAYHIPASRLGLVEDSSRANGDESERVYSSLCLGPRLQRYEEPITMNLLPRLGLDPARYAFEFTPVDVADKEFKRIASSEAFGRGAITLNEYRDSIGFGPDKNGKGDVYFIPMGSIVSEEPESSPAMLAPSFPVSGNTLEEPNQSIGIEAGEVASLVKAEVGRALAESAKAKDSVSEDRRELASLRFLSGHDKHERKLASNARSILTREAKKISAAARDGTLSITLQDAEVRSVGNDIFGDSKIHWLEALEGASVPAQKAGFDLLPADLDIGLSVSFNLFNESAVEYAKTRALENSILIVEGSQELVRGVVAQGVEEGWSQDKLAREIVKAYDGNKNIRAKTIARTEVSNAMNHGKREHARLLVEEYDLKLTKTWLSVVGDQRTREWHRQANIDPITVSMDEDFMVGPGDGLPMSGPGDSRGGAANVINCRCALLYNEA